jgi:hypothetical protein
MHFHLRWSGHDQGFGHGGNYAGDGCYGHVSHQQGREVSEQENRTIWNAKSDHLVSQEAATTLGHQHEQRTPSEPHVDQLGGNQEKIGPESESSANGEVKPDAETNPEEVAAQQTRVPEVKTETRTDVGTGSWRLQNRTI